MLPFALDLALSAQNVTELQYQPSLSGWLPGGLLAGCCWAGPLAGCRVAEGSAFLGVTINQSLLSSDLLRISNFSFEKFRIL